MLALDQCRLASPTMWLLAPVPDTHCDSRASAYRSSGTVCPQSWALTMVWEYRSPTRYPCLEIPVLIPPDWPHPQAAPLPLWVSAVPSVK